MSVRAAVVGWPQRRPHTATRIPRGRGRVGTKRRLRPPLDRQRTQGSPTGGGARRVEMSPRGAGGPEICVGSGLLRDNIDLHTDRLELVTCSLRQIVSARAHRQNAARLQLDGGQGSCITNRSSSAHARSALRSDGWYFCPEHRLKCRSRTPER